MGRVRPGITIKQANAQMAEQKAAKAIEAAGVAVQKAAGVVEAAAKPRKRKTTTSAYDFTGVNKDQMVAFCINHGINLPKSDTREALERVIKRFVKTGNKNLRHYGPRNKPVKKYGPRNKRVQRHYGPRKPRSDKGKKRGPRKTKK